MYRPREWKKDERIRDKRAKKRDWFRGKDGDKEAVIFIPATPGSELQKRFKKVIKEAKVGIAVVELAGTSMKRRLQRSDPFKEDVCRKASKCMVCSGEGGGRGGCRHDSVTYEIICTVCLKRYLGETARNGYTRGLEHKSALSRRDINSVLYQHCREDHGGRVVPFKMRITGNFGGDALKRQLTESVMIQESPPDEILNRRDEWRHIQLPRVTLC